MRGGRARRGSKNDESVPWNQAVGERREEDSEGGGEEISVEGEEEEKGARESDLRGASATGEEGVGAEEGLEAAEIVP